MPRYYHLTTDGPDTNLQLYSLRQAAKYWANVCADAAADGYVEDFHERCVFVICSMGLSVSQLLGQNVPNPSERVPSPQKIFASLMAGHKQEASLGAEFQRFIDRYDQCRHFGLTIDSTRHHEVSQVTLEEARWVFDFGLKVWNLVIRIYRQDPSSELEDLDLERLLHEP